MHSIKRRLVADWRSLGIWFAARRLFLFAPAFIFDLRNTPRYDRSKKPKLQPFRPSREKCAIGQKKCRSWARWRAYTNWRAAPKREAYRQRANRIACRWRDLWRDRQVCHAPSQRLWLGQRALLGRWCSDGLWGGKWALGLCVFPGFHGFWRITFRNACREDL